MNQEINDPTPPAQVEAQAEVKATEQAAQHVEAAEQEVVEQVEAHADEQADEQAEQVVEEINQTEGIDDPNIQQQEQQQIPQISALIRQQLIDPLIKQHIDKLQDKLNRTSFMKRAGNALSKYSGYLEEGAGEAAVVGEEAAPLVLL